MRLRMPELLRERGMTAYALARASGGRIDISQAYRLTRRHGRLRYLDSKLLDALCDVLRVEPDALFERSEVSAATQLRVGPQPPGGRVARTDWRRKR